MIPAARPLELTLRSEQNLEETQQFESLSKRTVAEELRGQSSRSRRKILAATAPFIVLAVLMSAWWFTK